jgi:phosphoribosyl 1,2-cyclic phosphodiesterase
MIGQQTLHFGRRNPATVRVLGSSSSGNATLVRADGTALLVDCGLGPRYTARALKTEGLALESLSGVVVTHTHSDHIRQDMLAALMAARVPLYCPEQIRPALMHYYPMAGELLRRGLFGSLKRGEGTIGGMELKAFEVPHDSPGGCFGYSIMFSDRKVTVATDIGYPVPAVVENFAGSDVMVIESNHDPEMLEGSGRPEWLKRRIRERGHLSNNQCAGLVTAIMHRTGRPPLAVVLAHISQQCNTNLLAVSVTRAALDAEGLHDLPVFETFRSRTAAAVEIATPEG